MTHEQIGKGIPALVFVFDPNLVVSGEQTAQMNKARDQIGDKVLFLVAKIGTPEGDDMIERYRARSAELLLFDESGALIKRGNSTKDALELIGWFDLAKP